MKKYIIGLLTIIMCFTLVGCINTKTTKGNKDFGEYTGIYELGKVKFKLAQYKNTVLITITKNNELYGNTSLIIENNKIKDIDYDFELEKNQIKIKSKNKDVQSGTYKRIDSYSTKEIYKDYIGDISLLDKNSGIYKKDNNILYIIQSNENTLRIANYTEEESTNIELNKESNNHFTTDFFEDKYDVKINKETLELKLESESKKGEILTGTYKKESKINATDAIKIFVFDDYIKE